MIRTEYVLKRDDGAYYYGHWRGRADTTDSLYDSPRYAERGAKSARGWLRDKERWSIVPITVEVKEAE